MTISLDKKYKTRDGRNVRLFVTDARCNIQYPVQGEFELIRGEWCSEAWTEIGSHLKSVEEHPLDLIEVKPTVIKPYRFYRKPDGVVYLTLPGHVICTYYATADKVEWTDIALSFLADAEEIDNPFLGDNI